MRLANKHAKLPNFFNQQLAAVFGQLEALVFARRNGCPWDERTCNYAVAEGHLDVLMFAHENGCPWSVVTRDTAVENLAVDEILECLNENGCPDE